MNIYVYISYLYKRDGEIGTLLKQVVYISCLNMEPYEVSLFHINSLALVNHAHEVSKSLMLFANVLL